MAKDVCGILGFDHPTDAIKYLDDDEKGVINCHTLGGNQTVTTLSELGLDDDERESVLVDTLGGCQEMITVANPDSNPRAGIPHQFTAISESGLYALIFRSLTVGWNKSDFR